MALPVVFVIFILCMSISLASGISMLYPLGIGLILFSALSLKKGFSLRQILGFAVHSFRDSFIVIRILLIIGCLIGAWRQSGTIACFISLGVSMIPPRGFLLAVFLLSSVMSYAIGTSFGVTATAGVILINIARGAGVNPVLTAGAILSGVYVGDRGSPAASSANLVSVLTHTDMRQNIRDMLKFSIVPFLLCCLIYGLLSLFMPVSESNSQITGLLASAFHLEWTCLIPAVIMIVLPFAGLNVRHAMGISLVSAVLLSVFLQGNSLPEALRCLVCGYQSTTPGLEDMLSGGGIVSMLEVCGILLISGTYGGIFRGTGLLEGFHRKLQLLARRLGRFPVMLLLGGASCALFCNQTIGAIMQNQLSAPLYGESDDECKHKMMDMENSVILLAGLVPWCIASSVPLGMLGADIRSLPFAFYLWLVPLYALIRSLRAADPDKAAH